MLILVLYFYLLFEILDLNIGLVIGQAKLTEENLTICFSEYLL